jgi:sucrose-6-phosphate hydrolase SacC (GH32 family)
LLRVRCLLRLLFVGLAVAAAPVTVTAPAPAPAPASALPAGTPWFNDSVWLPRFHIRPGPEATTMNDPCGPFVFNGMWHVFFQDHISSGTAWGHVVSADGAHFAHLPPAIVVDRPSDGMSINTGSVTVVNGVPTAVYNGGILRPVGNETHGKVEGQSVAFAANLSDPRLKVWRKPSYNPIIPHSPPGADHCPSFRDDSAAWRSQGEWKMIASGCSKQLLYSSKDFVIWRYEGNLFDEGSECPDFFELNTTALAAANSGTAPTHVLKTGTFRLGSYNQTAQRFVPTAGAIGEPFPTQDGATGYSFDTYAGKSFVDGMGRRRWYEWVQELNPFNPCGNMSVPVQCNPWPLERTWGSMLSLAYVLSYEPDRLPHKLIQRPPPELELLRVRVDIDHKDIVVPITSDTISAVPLALPAGAGKAMEVMLRFRRPQRAGSYELGLRLLESTGLNQTHEVTIVSMLVDTTDTDAADGGTVTCVVDRSQSSSVAMFAGGYPFFKHTGMMHTNATVPLAAAGSGLGEGASEEDGDLLMHVVVDHS